MRIAVTGARGFIARNLVVRLREVGETDVVLISHDIGDDDLKASLIGVELVYHLSGVNRPEEPSEFATGNVGFTERLCQALASASPMASVVFSSSTQAMRDNDYGRSKKAAEDVLIGHGATTGTVVTLFRLTNVFGKWSRPNYNSAVATFCHNVSRDMPIIVSNPDAPLKLVYIDDVVDATYRSIMDNRANNQVFGVGSGVATTVIEVAETLKSCYGAEVSIHTTGNFRLGDIRHNYADLTKIRALLDFEPKFDFKTGIRNFSAWVNEQTVQTDNYDKSMAEMKAKGLFK